MGKSLFFKTFYMSLVHLVCAVSTYYALTHFINDIEVLVLVVFIYVSMVTTDGISYYTRRPVKKYTGLYYYIIFIVLSGVILNAAYIIIMLSKWVLS